MILYLDTSSLLKLYFPERHAERVREWVAEADHLATSCVALPESAGAVARRHREGILVSSEASRILDTLQAEWDRYLIVPVQERKAASLAVAHGLRGFDAVHLAAAIGLAEDIAAGGLAFTSFDATLNAAARREGLPVRDAAP